MSAADAARFDQLQRGDPVAYQQAVNQYFGIEPSPAKPSGAAAPVQPSAIEGQEAQPVETKPAEPAVAEAPTRVADVTPRRLTVTETGLEEKEAQLEQEQRSKVITGRIEADLKREADFPNALSQAKTLFGASERVLSNLGKNPKAFGLLAKPGIVNSLLTVAKEGITTPQGSVSFANIEEALLPIMPGTSVEAIAARQKVASDLAEIELAFTQQFLKGQGQVTEGERQVVRRIGGNVSNNPTVLLDRMVYLQARTQFDIDRISDFDQWKQNNPDKTVSAYEQSTQYKELVKNYDKELARLFNVRPAQTTSERAAQTPKSGSKGGISVQDIDEEMKRRGLKK
jgi:hypothetical protein